MTVAPLDRQLPRPRTARVALNLLGLVGMAVLLIGLTETAWARSLGPQRHPALHGKHRAQAPVTLHDPGSVLVANLGIVAALAGGDDEVSPLRYSEKDWLERHAARFSGRDVRCELCVRSAILVGDAQPGEAVIGPQIDMAAITRQLTTLEIAGSTVRVTSLAPFGLLFRRPF